MKANAKKPMPRATVQAILESIEKWEGIEAGTLTDQCIDNCALCIRFFDGGLCSFKRREKCPVYAATGQRACRGTPYSDWSSKLNDNPLDKTADTPELKKIAHAEVLFLRSLLPEGKS